MIRRLAAAIMAAALLHLSVTPSDAACVDHGAMASRHVATASMGGLHQALAHGAHAVEDVAARTPPPPCDAPAQPSCCGAIAGCAATALASPRPPSPPAMPDAAPAHESPASVLTSRRAAPEPPPPKR